MRKIISELIEISQYAGCRADYVQGGGGNTSVKEGDVMLIKASGYRLCDIGEQTGFVAVKYSIIKDYYLGVDVSQNKDFEKESKAITQSAIIATEGMPTLRPSVEVGFHAILKKYVIHTHSIYTNLLTCCKEGQEIAKKLFAGKDFGYIFMPYIDPGFTLSVEMHKAIENYVKTNGGYPEVIFMQNHGIVVTGDYLERTKAINTEINEAVRNYFNLPDTMSAVKVEKQAEAYVSKTPFVEKCRQKVGISKEFFVKYPLCPDQLVYLNNTLALMPDKMICQKDKIFYNCSLNEATVLEESLTAFLFVVTTIFDKGLTLSLMNQKDVDFINNWEAEKYRRTLVK